MVSNEMKPPRRFMLQIEAFPMQSGMWSTWVAVSEVRSGKTIFENAYETHTMMDGIWQASVWWIARYRVLEARGEAWPIPIIDPPKQLLLDCLDPGVLDEESRGDDPF